MFLVCFVFNLFEFPNGDPVSSEMDYVNILGKTTAQSQFCVCFRVKTTFYPEIPEPKLPEEWPTTPVSLPGNACPIRIHL